MLTGMVCPIKISSLLPHTPAKIPHVKRISNIKEADFSFSYQDLTFFIVLSGESRVLQFTFCLAGFLGQCVPLV
jgi:hypothetical protein